MKKLAVLLTVLGMSTPALAGDSSWLLCKGVGDIGPKEPTRRHVVVSAHEHRGAKDGRDVSVTMIYGVHISRGVLTGTQKGKIKLVSVDNKKPVFTGTVELSDDFKTFTLSGSIDETSGDAPKQTMEPFTAKLACELLDDQAIGK